MGAGIGTLAPMCSQLPEPGFGRGVTHERGRGPGWAQGKAGGGEGCPARPRRLRPLARARCSGAAACEREAPVASGACAPVGVRTRREEARTTHERDAARAAEGTRTAAKRAGEERAGAGVRGALVGADRWACACSLQAHTAERDLKACTRSGCAHTPARRPLPGRLTRREPGPGKDCPAQCAAAACKEGPHPASCCAPPSSISAEAVRDRQCPFRWHSDWA